MIKFSFFEKIRFSWVRYGFLSVFSFFCILTLTFACSPGTFTSGADSTTSIGGPQNPPPTTVLKIGIDPTFAPFQFMSGSGPAQFSTDSEPMGFEIDLIKAIAKVADFGIDFKILPFNKIIPALENNSLDAAISAITITPEREQIIDFTQPYFESGLAIVTQASNIDINSFTDLKNRKLGTTLGTTGETKAKEAKAEVTTFKDISTALQALNQGKVDAVLNDMPVIIYLIKNKNIEGIKVLESLLNTEYYAIATPQNSPNLKLLDEGLAEIKESGQYEKIYQKWFKP